MHIQSMMCQMKILNKGGFHILTILKNQIREK